MLNRVFAVLSAAIMSSASMRLVPTAATASLGTSRKQSKAHPVHKQGGKKLNRSHHTPHFGEKQQEKAARCYMETRFPAGNPRSAPVMLQVSKKRFYKMVERAEAQELAAADETFALEA